MKRSMLLVLLAALAGVAHAQAPAAPAAAKPAATAVSAAELEAKLAQVESPELVEQVARQFRTQADLASEAIAWARAVKLRPHLGRYKLEMAAAFAQQDRKREAYNALLELQNQGYAFAIASDKRFEKISTTEVWTYIVQGFDSNRAPFGEGKVAYTLPREDLLIESLAWDASRKQLLAGSAREGRVYRVDAKGKLTALVSADAENGMWAVFDLVVDAQRGVLWIASTAVPHFKGYDAERDLGRAGVFKFDLKTGKFLKKFLSPTIAGQDFFLSTLALGKDGEIYAADGVNNAVYQIRDDQFRRLFHAPSLTSIRGITTSADGRVLYLADYERGIIGFDLASSKPFDIAVPKTLALGGIDGLMQWKGDLIAVQNGMNPPRLMRYTLAKDGRSIASVHPLDANQSALTMPTLGTIGGDTVYVIANSQKRNYDRFGLLIDRNKLEATRIFSSKADFKPPQDPKRMVPVTSP
jgi:sugar lactone lactonase YvrE